MKRYLANNNGNNWSLIVSSY